MSLDCERKPDFFANCETGVITIPPLCCPSLWTCILIHKLILIILAAQHKMTGLWWNVIPCCIDDFKPDNVIVLITTQLCYIPQCELTQNPAQYITLQLLKHYFKEKTVLLCFRCNTWNCSIKCSKLSELWSWHICAMLN